MVSSSFAPNGLAGNGAYAHIPVDTITAILDDIDWQNALIAPALSGVITVDMATGLITGSGGTSFTTELTDGDFIYFNDGANPASQLIAQVQNIFSNTSLQSDAQTLSPPPGVGTPPFTYTNVSYIQFDPIQITGLSVILEASMDTTATGNPNAIAGNRLYYSQFNAYNWNTGVVENIAQTYATSTGGFTYDLGRQDYTGWEAVITTLLTYAGWNPTITTVIPDTSTIDNSNQEIVVYYVQGNYLYNGATSPVIESMTFYEQSDVVQDYQSQLGLIPFQLSQVDFNIRDGYGYWGSIGTIVNPIAGGFPAIYPGISDALPASFGEDVNVGFWGTSYNSTQNMTLTNKDFEKGQFQVFVKYTTYDGIEAVVAKKLVEMGISVNPENVNWYVKEMQDRGDLEEIEWPFDDEEEAPVEENPETFDPTSENPLDYIPENRKQEEGEEDAD